MLCRGERASDAHVMPAQLERQALPDGKFENRLPKCQYLVGRSCLRLLVLHRFLKLRFD
jgi:hypothetical protein